MKKIISDDVNSRLDALIKKTEKSTGAQIVFAVIRRSDNYAELPWKAFALGASIAGLLVFILNMPFNDWSLQIAKLFIIAVILASGAFCALLTIIIPGFARWFLSKDRSDVEVNQYAKSLFLDHELFATKNRSGILFLVSLFERKVVILPDKGLNSQLTEETMQSIITSMTPFLKRKEIYKAFEAGMERLSGLLKSEASGTGENELPDEIIEEKGI